MPYGTNEGFLDWLAAQGLTMPAGADPTVLRNIGSSYTDAAYEWRLNCSRRAGGFDQALAWPRVGHTFNGETVPSTLIPTSWVYASYRAAWLESQTPGWATGSTDPTHVTSREKVDVIERSFFAPGEVNAPTDVAPGMAVDGIIGGLVSPWLCSNARRPWFQVL